MANSIVQVQRTPPQVVDRTGGLYSRYMRRATASEYLGNIWGIERKPTSLAKLACIGGGPRFVKAGRIPLYRPDWLDDWARNLIGETAEAA
ncbi:hypothetical protein [Geminicoccus flavidas]|uniref:hypothetical protein n=1 Tax=Geminicoccus flavidas TaxID=2506407 RepID=UPI00190F8148|nr:hypothetical protein [Geminicoccus flavidas]